MRRKATKHQTQSLTESSSIIQFSSRGTLCAPSCWQTSIHLLILMSSFHMSAYAMRVWHGCIVRPFPSAHSSTTILLLFWAGHSQWMGNDAWTDAQKNVQDKGYVHAHTHAHRPGAGVSVYNPDAIIYQGGSHVLAVESDISNQHALNMRFYCLLTLHSDAMLQAFSANHVIFFHIFVVWDPCPGLNRVCFSSFPHPDDTL